MVDGDNMRQRVSNYLILVVSSPSFRRCEYLMIESQRTNVPLMFLAVRKDHDGVSELCGEVPQEVVF